jgi:uncharacterized cupredoxin-like copper-binding protein
MAILANCEAPMRARTNGSGSARAREIVITTVPLLTKELATTYPFPKKDFATGGVLAGKEVYEFMPSTITVVEGDTLRLTFINPEDDAHSFVMDGGDWNTPLVTEPQEPLVRDSSAFFGRRYVPL